MRMKGRRERLFTNNYREKKLFSFTIFMIIVLASFTVTFMVVPLNIKSEGAPQQVNLLPDGEGSVQQWGIYSLFPGTENHWDKVDDPVAEHDEDNTYVHEVTRDDIDEFNHATSELLEGVEITNVRVTARMKKTISGLP